MTNFERNMTNATQKRNTTNLVNKLDRLEIEHTVESQEGYNFVSVFYLLDYEFAINPDGSMTIMDWSDTINKDVETVDEVVNFIVEKLQN